jgi:hypothetical protein
MIETEPKLNSVPPGGKTPTTGLMQPEDDDSRVTRLYQEIRELPLSLANRLAKLLKKDQE